MFLTSVEFLQVRKPQGLSDGRSLEVNVNFVEVKSAGRM